MLNDKKNNTEDRGIGNPSFCMKKMTIKKNNMVV